MSIFYILLLFACLGVVASCKVEHKDIGWKDAGSKTNLTIEEAEHIAKFQSFAAPDGEISQNQTHEEALHIAESYIKVFNELVKAKSFTELASHFEYSFYFASCTSYKWVRVGRGDFVKLVENLQANWKLNDAKFVTLTLILVTLDMNVFGYVDSLIAHLQKHPDGSWKWENISCRERKCVDLKYDK